MQKQEFQPGAAHVRLTETNTNQPTSCSPYNLSGSVPVAVCDLKGTKT